MTEKNKLFSVREIHNLTGERRFFVGFIQDFLSIKKNESAVLNSDAEIRKKRPNVPKTVKIHLYLRYSVQFIESTGLMKRINEMK